MSVRSRLSSICTVAGVASLLFAGGLAGYNQVENSRAEASSQAALAEVAKAEGTVEAAPDEYVNPYDEAALERLNHMPVVTVDGYDYVARVNIPAIGVELPVMAEWSGDYGALSVAPVRQYGTARGGGLVIAGHNYASHFGSLSKLNQGDDVYVIDMAGNLYVYTVSSIEVLPGNALDKVSDGVWDLTLYTCTYGGESRVTVRCTKA